MIGQTIQLAMTPAFALVAIGNLMAVLSTRLGRVVDRSRQLQALHASTSGPAQDMVVIEMREVDRRMTLITQSIRLMVLSAVAIGTTVALLFLDSLLDGDLQAASAVFFIIAIALLMASLIYFLRETQVAAATLRIPRDYLELHRKL
jgi:MFS family permease